MVERGITLKPEKENEKPVEQEKSIAVPEQVAKMDQLDLEPVDEFDMVAVPAK